MNLVGQFFFFEWKGGGFGKTLFLFVQQTDKLSQVSLDFEGALRKGVFQRSNGLCFEF